MREEKRREGCVDVFLEKSASSVPHDDKLGVGVGGSLAVSPVGGVSGMGTSPALAACARPRPALTPHQDLETMSREMELWVRDAQVQQQRYDDERRKTEVELEPLLIKLQVCGRVT